MKRLSINSESLGDYRDPKEHIWECYISIGDRYYKNGEYEQAIKTYNTAMKLKESDRIQTKIRKCYIGIGDRYYENNEFENAIAHTDSDGNERYRCASGKNQ